MMMMTTRSNNSYCCSSSSCSSSSSSSSSSSLGGGKGGRGDVSVSFSSFSRRRRKKSSHFRRRALSSNSSSSSSEVNEVEVEVNERAKHYFTKDSFYEHADKLYSSFQKQPLEREESKRRTVLLGLLARGESVHAIENTGERVLLRGGDIK